MTIIESRIGLADLICDGCDCGQCVAQSLEELGGISGVRHVRVDRMRTQIVVRHDEGGVSLDQLSDVVKAKGLQITGQGSTRARSVPPS